MAIKIYGVAQSGSVRRVAVVCKLLNIEYKVIFIDVPNHEHKEPTYLEKHPFGQIPYIDDGGFLLFESRAIARYLVAKFGGESSLAPSPTSPGAYARFEQACSIEYTNFEPYTFGITDEKVFKPRHGEPTDETVVAALTSSLEGKLLGYERILAKQKYLAGDNLTLADLFHLPYGGWMVPLGVNLLEDEQRFPNVARWWKDITLLPAWQAVKNGA